MQVRMTFDLPVSINKMYGYAPSGSGWRRVLKPEARRYKRDAAWTAKAQYRGPVIVRNIGVIVQHHPVEGSAQHHDSDNILKLLFDACQGVVFANDKQIQIHTVVRREPIKGGGVVMTVCDLGEYFPALMEIVQ